MQTKVYYLDRKKKGTPAISKINLKKYQKELNQPQLDSVKTTEGSLLVIAGAGTGKTKTLTYRTGYLIESGLSAPENVLLLTFTRRAAQEMLVKASAVCDRRCAEINGGTFHAYAYKIISQAAPAIGLPNKITILDNSDAQDVVDIARASVHGKRSDKRFPKKKVLLNIISTSRNKMISIEDFVAEYYPHFLGDLTDIIKVALNYESYKRDNGFLDYDDLLFFLRDILTIEKERKKIASSVRYLMVDEFQDTNAIQGEIVKLLSSEFGNIMVVGDDAQSIYSFRGATPRNILDFPKEYKDTKTIKLEQNYRSTPNILSFANSIMMQASEKIPKVLFSSQKEKGELPAIVSAQNEQYQSAFIAQHILELREEGVPLSEIAVLMRNGRDSFDLELVLTKQNIPFVKHGGQKLVESAHLKDFIAFVRIMHNKRDTLSWSRVLKLIPKVGGKTASNIAEWIKKSQNPFNLEQCSYAKKNRTILISLGKALNKTFDIAQDIPLMLEKLQKIYTPLLKQNYYDDYPKRKKDIDNFSSIFSNYNSIETLLADVALEPIQHSVMGSEPLTHDEDPLTLSTIHSAKGLEWHTVFVINVLEGVIPSAYASGIDDLDEELRLFYVAVTRAKKEIYLSYPMISHPAREKYFSKISPFLEDIPESLFQKITLAVSPS